MNDHLSNYHTRALAEAITVLSSEDSLPGSSGGLSDHAARSTSKWAVQRRIYQFIAIKIDLNGEDSSNQ